METMLLIGGLAVGGYLVFRSAGGRSLSQMALGLDANGNPMPPSGSAPLVAPSKSYPPGFVPDVVGGGDPGPLVVLGALNPLNVVSTLGKQLFTKGIGSQGTAVYRDAKGNIVAAENYQPDGSAFGLGSLAAEARKLGFPLGSGNAGTGNASGASVLPTAPTVRDHRVGA